MKKREFVVAALAAAVLTVGTAKSAWAAGCMEWCAENVGDAIFEVETISLNVRTGDVTLTGNLYELSNCTESGSASGSTYTCTYSQI